MSIESPTERPLYRSTEELLAPETLSVLTGLAVRQVRCTPIDGGASGARLLAVEAINGSTSQRFILKRMSPEWDWIMLASEDRHCRAVALWQHGLLGRLESRIDHTIIACASDRQEWAMLMRDASAAILNEHQPRTEREVRRVLDGLAFMHAAFWNAPELADPALSLCDFAGLIRYGSPETARRYPYPESFIPTFVTEGWPLLLEMVAPDVASVLQALVTDPQPLHAALARYPFTLLHGDFRSANLGLSQQAWPVTAFDWGWSGYGVPTVDLAWFLYWHDVVQAPISTGGAVSHYRARLAEYLGQPIPEQDWQPMWELGVLANNLRIACLRAWFIAYADDADFRAIYRELMAPLNDQVRAAVRWL